MGRTASKSSFVISMEDGTFFVEDETPTGAINGSNKTFTLANTPNPASSLQLLVNGQDVTQGDDFTLSGDTITTTTAYPTGQAVLLASYRVEPSL